MDLLRNPKEESPHVCCEGHPHDGGTQDAAQLQGSASAVICSQSIARGLLGREDRRGEAECQPSYHIIHHQSMLEDELSHAPEVHGLFPKTARGGCCLFEVHWVAPPLHGVAELLWIQAARAGELTCSPLFSMASSPLPVGGLSHCCIDPTPLETRSTQQSGPVTLSRRASSI